MARTKKNAPVETPKEFDLFSAEISPSIKEESADEVIHEAVVTIDAAIEAAIIAEDKYVVKEWRCTAECPHYTRASAECQECWEKGHGRAAR